MNERFIAVSHFKYKLFYKSYYTVLIFLKFEIVRALEKGEAAGRVVAGLARVVLLIGEMFRNALGSGIFNVILIY